MPQLLFAGNSVRTKTIRAILEWRLHALIAHAWGLEAIAKPIARSVDALVTNFAVSGILQAVSELDLIVLKIGFSQHCSVAFEAAL